MARDVASPVYVEQIILARVGGEDRVNHRGGRLDQQSVVRSLKVTAGAVARTGVRRPLHTVRVPRDLEPAISAPQMLFVSASTPIPETESACNAVEAVAAAESAQPPVAVFVK